MELTLHQHAPPPAPEKRHCPFVQLNSQNKNPGEIYGHTCVSYKNQLFVFGGSDKQGKFSDFVFIYDSVACDWFQVYNTDGVRPKGRHFHTAVTWNHGMYIFGGKSSGYMNDFYRFDLITHTWTPVEVVSGRPPSKRYGHSTVIWGNSMWVFGGYDDFGYKSDELYQFRFDTKIWHKIKYSVSQPIEGLPVRLEKYQHTAIVHHDAMYVFGGRGEKKEQFCNDLLKYCFATSTWARVIAKGKLPSPRWGHGTVVYNGKMYITGGCDYVLNFNDMFKFKFETCTWTKVDVGDFDPRFFHTTTTHHDCVRTCMILFAGKNIHNYLFDGLYAYNFDESKDTFSSDMKLLLLQPENSDFAFCFPEEGNKTIYAHKAILMARCEAFRIMFNSGMKESASSKISISSDSYNPYLCMLHHIYTGKAEIDELTLDELLELLQLADRYFLRYLKGLCEHELKKFLSLQTVVLLYEVAEKSKAVSLKKACVKWAANRCDTIPMVTLSIPLQKEIEIRKLK